jgi:hypothetical protein
MRWHLALAAALIGVWAITAHAASTIVPNLLPIGIPANAGLINQNFGNAINDVNALQTQNAGVTPPSNPSRGYFWLSTPQNGTIYELNVWDGTKWLPIAGLDSVNHIWMPPIGGGVPPTILSATTTDLGSVPQATVSLSGVTTIQSFGASAPTGTIKVVLFTAATPLVNSASLVLPGNTNVTQTAGGVEVALAQGGGAWKVIFDSQSVLVGTGVNGVFVCPSITVANGLISSAAGAACPVNVATNAALQAITAPAAGTEVFRAGFYAAGDGGKANYTFSTSACSLNAGAGDNGSQVAPTAGSGCWLVQVPPTGLSFKVWGAKMDGATNDAAADQAALNWAGPVPGGTLQVPARGLSYTGSAQITDNGLPVIIHGNNPTNGNDNGACTSGFTDVAGGIGANINILSLTGTGSKIDHTCILAGSASTPATAGTVLTIGGTGTSNGVNQAATFDTIKFPYIGIAAGGSTHGSTDTNSLHLENDWVVSPSFAGIVIGQFSSNATTGGLILRGDRVTCAPPDTAAYGIAIYDGAIDHYDGTDITNCNQNLAVIPGAAGGSGQTVLGFFYDVLGDTGILNQLYIEPQTSQGKVEYFDCNGCWIGMNNNTTGAGAVIANRNGGVVQGITFSGGIAHGNNNNANSPEDIFDIEGNICGVTIVGMQIAADGGGADANNGINDNSTCSSAMVYSNDNYSFNAGTLGIGLHITSTAGDNRTIVGNNWSQTFTPFQFDPTSAIYRMTETNNFPLSTNTPSALTAAASIAAPLFDWFGINGTTTISNMSGFWQTRYVRIRANSAGLNFATGGGTGGFCMAFGPTTSGEIVQAYWNANNACWDLK